MTGRFPFNLAFTMSALALVACGETTAPSQSGTTGGPSPAASSIAYARNSWTKKAPMPDWPNNDTRDQPVSGHVGVAAGVANSPAGKPILYVFGGISDDGEHVWGDYAYNFATNSWSSGSRLALPFSNGVGRIGNKLYSSGGYEFQPGAGPEPSLMQSILRVYDPVTGGITRRSNVPRATAEGVTGVIDGKLYVLAGRCVSLGQPVACHTFYRYDPATNLWTKLAPTPSNHHSGAGGVINGKFYVAGGGNRSLDVYDPATNTWTTRAALPEVRSRTAGAVLGGKLYVIGGLGASGSKAVFAYDPVTNSWRTKASLNVGRSDLAAARITTLDGQSYILAVGGSFDGYRANEVYTP